MNIPGWLLLSSGNAPTLIYNFSLKNIYIHIIYMAAMKQFLKLVDNSLILLDIPLIRWLIIIVVILYNISAIPQINNTISQWFRWVWFRLFYMLMILYIGFKDRTLALLLGISFVLSLQILNSNGQESPSPYTEPISDDEPSSDNETTGRVVNANKVHDKSAYGDYLNGQFDDPLSSYNNTNQCNSTNDIAVTNKDKEILENPCSLNKD